MPEPVATGTADLLEQSQARLGRTLDQARMGEDRDLAGWVRDRGERLVRILYGVLRMTHLHALDNAAFEKPLAELELVIRQVFEVMGAIHLVTVEDQVFLNDIRVRLGRAEEASGLGAELRRHGVGGVSLHTPPSNAQLRLLVQRFAAPPDPLHPRAALSRAFFEAGFDQIDLAGIYRFRIAGDAASPVEDASHATPHRDFGRISARAADLVSESWDNLAASRLPNPLPMRRIVTEILESDGGGDALWLEPTAMSPYGEHALQVCRLALLLARAAGLSEENIQDLGVCAMFHDVGYAAREGADPASGDPGYPPPFERHAAAGARLLLRQRGFHQAKIMRALSTLEHHRDYAGGRSPPSLFGRILRVAEDYANLTRRGAGNLSPRRALQRMVPAAGTAYDPVLLQLFVNTLGAWPPGTLLELDDGRIVVSRSTVRSPETFEQPLVHILRSADGADLPEPVLLDLAVEGSGSVRRPLDDLPAGEARQGVMPGRM